MHKREPRSHWLAAMLRTKRGGLQNAFSEAPNRMETIAENGTGDPGTCSSFSLLLDPGGSWLSGQMKRSNESKGRCLLQSQEWEADTDPGSWKKLTEASLVPAGSPPETGQQTYSNRPSLDFCEQM